MDRSIGPDKPHPGRLEVGRVHIVSNTQDLPGMTVGREHTTGFGPHTLASGHTQSAMVSIAVVTYLTSS